MMEFGYGETVVRERRQQVPDPYRPSTTVPGPWDGPLDTLVIDGAFIASSSSVAPMDATRRQVLTEKSLYCTDPEVDVQVGDRVRRGGTAPMGPLTALIEWPNGLRVTLVREGDVVTAHIDPMGSSSLPIEIMPFPDAGFLPTGSGQFLITPSSTYALVVRDEWLGQPNSLGFAALGAAPFLPGTVRWLADARVPVSTGGELYYVNSRPAADQNPFTGWRPVVEIPLDMTEG